MGGFIRLSRFWYEKNCSIVGQGIGKVFGDPITFKKFPENSPEVDATAVT